MQQQSETTPATSQTELQQEIEEVIADPEVWLQTPNFHFGGMKPQELIDRDILDPIHNLIGMIKQGMFS